MVFDATNEIDGMIALNKVDAGIHVNDHVPIDVDL